MTRNAPRSHPTPAAYRRDPLYPRIAVAVDAILRRTNTVAPVDVLVHMGILTPDHLDAWRRGRVPCLERVIQGSLPRLSRLLRILALHAHDLNLVPTPTTYLRQGNAPRHPLRLTRTGDPGIEAAYSRHFVWPAKRPFHSPDHQETPP